MPISTDQARDIAKGYLDTSHEMGTYRFAHWTEIAPDDRQRMEDHEWDLLNYSSSLVTTAVGIVLNDMQNDLKSITDATSRARDAIAKIKAVKDVLTISAALVTLGGAIVSGHPGAIADSAKAALTALNAMGAPDKKSA